MEPTLQDRIKQLPQEKKTRKPIVIDQGCIFHQPGVYEIFLMVKSLRIPLALDQPNSLVSDELRRN